MVDFDPKFEQWKAQQQSNLEGLKAIVAFSVAALKSITVANGAGALALLAFLGHLVASKTQNAECAISELAFPMTWFAFGTACGIVATGGAYLAQVCFVEFQRSDGKNNICGTVFRLVAVAIAFLGIGSFIYGVISSGKAFEFIAICGN